MSAKEPAEYAKALDRLGETQAEHSFLQAAQKSFIDNPGELTTAEYSARYKASGRLLDAAWKAVFEAARAKEAAQMRLNEARTPATPQALEAIKAAAYDEGFTACAGEHIKQQKDPRHPITRINPYASKERQ